MIKKNCLHFVFILLSGLSFAQTQIIPLQGDTSGYLENNNYSPKSGVTSDVIPTIKGELNINSLGALTYNIPIEVFKGVNNFQPNLALAYSSDSGNGQAGYGWNLVGLSVITQGGKSKKIDGIYEGAQFNDNDPYYLDGQRLIQIGNSQEYQTEHFSHIKITKLNSTNGYTFLIKYPDGKIAKYKNVTI